MPARAAEGGHDDVDAGTDLTDLDSGSTVTGPPPTRQSGRRAIDAGPGPVPREGRNPWVVPIAVAVLVALVGLTAVRAARTAAVEDLVVAEQAAAIELGTTRVLSDPDGPQFDQEDRLVLSLQVPAQNNGESLVTVMVSGSSTDHATLRAPSPPTGVPAGSSAFLAFELAVDCSAVPSAQDTTDALNRALRAPTTERTQWLDVQVEVDDRQLERRYSTADPPGADIAYALPLACDAPPA